MTYYRGQLFPMSFVEELFSIDAIVEGRYGGLLIGPSHNEGGIITCCLYDGGMIILSEVEGYEYIVNNKSNPEHLEELIEINNYHRDFEETFVAPSIPNETPIIDATSNRNSIYPAKFLILSYKGGEAIVNKHSTRIYIDSLNRINSKIKWNPY